jgi:hypothetical protein
MSHQAWHGETRKPAANRWRQRGAIRHLRMVLKWRQAKDAVTRCASYIFCLLLAARSGGRMRAAYAACAHAACELESRTGRRRRLLARRAPRRPRHCAASAPFSCVFVARKEEYHSLPLLFWRSSSAGERAKRNGANAALTDDMHSAFCDHHAA